MLAVHSEIARMDSPLNFKGILIIFQYHTLDYWIARLRKETTAWHTGLMDCCKSKSYARITIWGKLKIPIMKFSLQYNIYGFS